MMYILKSNKDKSKEKKKDEWPVLWYQFYANSYTSIWFIIESSTMMEG